MNILLTTLFLIFWTTIIAQKVRLEGDNSRYLCLNDSLAETFTEKLTKDRVDSTITILYDFDNGRLQNSRRIIIWTHNGISNLRLVEGCDKILRDTTYSFNSASLWQYIGVTHFDDVTVPIKSAYSQSHDRFYHITVTTSQKSFFTVVRNYERRNDDKNKTAQSDTRVILTNKIDDLFQ